MKTPAPSNGSLKPGNGNLPQPETGSSGATKSNEDFRNMLLGKKWKLKSIKNIGRQHSVQQTLLCSFCLSKIMKKFFMQTDHFGGIANWRNKKRKKRKLKLKDTYNAHPPNCLLTFTFVFFLKIIVCLIFMQRYRTKTQFKSILKLL